MEPAETIIVCSIYVIFRSFSSPLDYSGSIGGWTAVVCTGLSHLLLLACLFVWRDIVKTLNDFMWEYWGFWNQSNNWVTTVSLLRNIYFDILVSSFNNTWHKNYCKNIDIENILHPSSKTKIQRFDYWSFLVSCKIAETLKIALC